MKYAHIADCHIGSWREPRLKEVSTQAFEKAVEICVDKNVDFVLISGDLFNTSVPPIDNLKAVVVKLSQLRKKGIKVYVIPGSHDFSPSGKTIIDVLEHAGLVVNAAKGEVVDERLKLKFTVDEKTGVKITGLLGKKGGLERSYYENLIHENLESEEGYKIFMFHTALTEFKPKELEGMEAAPLSLLPKGFNYYAGGHVHYVFEKNEEGYGKIAYPGPLFPNNFKELEDLGRGGFYIIEDERVEFCPIQIHNTYHIKINCDNKTCEQIENEIMEEVNGKEFINTIVTLRLEGVLKAGKPSDINFKKIIEKIYERGAYFVMRNTYKLNSQEFEEIKTNEGSVEEVEESLIKEHIGQIKIEGISEGKEIVLVKELMNVLSSERGEGERVAEFENNVKKDAEKVFEGVTSNQ